MMNKEVIAYMEDKIKNGNSAEIEFDKTLLNLYKKGLVQIKIEEGEPLVQISEEGAQAYMQELSLSLSDVIEA